MAERDRQHAILQEAGGTVGIEQVHQESGFDSFSEFEANRLMHEKDMTERARQIRLKEGRRTADIEMAKKHESLHGDGLLQVERLQAVREFRNCATKVPNL